MLHRALDERLLVWGGRGDLVFDATLFIYNTFKQAGFRAQEMWVLGLVATAAHALRFELHAVVEQQPEYKAMQLRPLAPQTIGKQFLLLVNALQAVN